MHQEKKESEKVEEVNKVDTKIEHIKSHGDNQDLD